MLKVIILLSEILALYILLDERIRKTINKIKNKGENYANTL